MRNSKKTSQKMASDAAKTLSNVKSSKIQKTLAASVLAQTNTDKQTGENMETIASNVLKSDKYNDTTKSLAASVLAQSNKDR